MINLMAKAVATLVVLSIVFFPIESLAQDSLSTIYFYRQKSGSSMRYEVNEGKTQIGRMKPGSVAVYHCTPGSHDFIAAGKTASVFKMITEQGKEYYVDCIVRANTPALRLSRRGEARRQISKIDKNISEKIAPVVITTSPDTVRALQHMFKRKRGWGIACTVFGAFATPYFIATLINYEPKEETSGSLTTTTDETPSYVVAVVNGMTVTIVGAALWSNHTPRKLTTILENKAEGIPFPPKLLSHLKKEDFQKQ